MMQINDTIWCEGCDVEITVAPVYYRGYPYCCRACAAGLPCWCGLFWSDAEDYERDNSRLWPGQAKWGDHQ